METKIISENTNSCHGCIDKKCFNCSDNNCPECPGKSCKNCPSLNLRDDPFKGVARFGYSEFF
jgi:hypothetical protein